VKTDPLASAPPMTERVRHDTELCHAFGAAACQMAEWIRRCDADACNKREALSRIADVADLHLSRLKAEGGP